MPLGILRELGASVQDSLLALGRYSIFAARLAAETPRALLRFRLVVDQVHNAGVLSLVIIMLSGLFVGMVLGLQGFDLLERFGSEESLGSAAALGLLKELGPVVTALLFAGRAGTALASELGLMRATDQISAIEMMAVDPVRRVVMPRFLGGTISMPLLAGIFSMIGLYGAQSAFEKAKRDLLDLRAERTLAAITAPAAGTITAVNVLAAADAPAGTERYLYQVHFGVDEETKQRLMARAAGDVRSTWATEGEGGYD